MRCTQAGVHAGVLVSQEGAVIRLRESRRLWRWKRKLIPFGVGERVAYVFKAAPKFGDCILLNFDNILAVVP